MRFISGGILVALVGFLTDRIFYRVSESGMLLLPSLPLGLRSWIGILFNHGLWDIERYDPTSILGHVAVIATAPRDVHLAPKDRALEESVHLIECRVIIRNPHLICVYLG